MKTYYTVKSSHYNSSKYIFDSLSQAENKVSQLKKEYPNEPVEVVQLVLLSDHDKIVAELKAENERIKTFKKAEDIFKLYSDAEKQIEALTQQLNEAEKVIEYYSDPIEVESGNDNEPWRGRVVFGKRARTYIAKKKGAKP